MSITAPISLQFPATSPTSTTINRKPLQFTTLTPNTVRLRLKPRNRSLITKAIEESKEETVKSEVLAEQEFPEKNQPVELSELGEEIKKAMKERKDKEQGGLFSGVAEEIREIEWPAFGKVLGTTGAVLSIIAGSSVVLLTVNGLLAELSDRVFAGKGVQDFFS